MMKLPSVPKGTDTHIRFKVFYNKFVDHFEPQFA